MIQLVNVDKTFHIPAGASSDGKPHTVHAVQNVSLSIEDGDIFGVIGFSGAGKSTLVRCINLLERPDRGQVLVDGEDVTGLPESELRHRRKKIGMIFQHFNLFRSRTVGDNVAFSLKYTGMKKDAIQVRVTELLELVGLSDKEHAYPSQLSGGQKQRVGIARALASNPRVLLCDEATSALDPQTTRSILALLKELNKKLGITIVIITHEMQVIKTICSHAAVMDQGLIVEQGPVFDIFSNPQKQITRDFVAATSHLYKIYDLLEESSPVIKLKPDQLLAHFSYQGRNTVDALISTASIEFNVKLNIIFGDLDIIQDTPIGGLIIIMEGEKGALKRTLEWFTRRAVEVKILQKGEDHD
ncbi:MAG: ATP-binding cassette domain-containing protein [Spirochaetaceae bacterium]|jgi:D-methionine transport system ATP-binding protein|nr:ATP-binding cassette domain-containing protein [Spirochaetaceae bacterium]